MNVAIEDNGGTIRIRFQLKGVRYSFCPFKGARYSNKTDKRKAEAIGKRIEADVLLDCFDSTLERYKGEPLENRVAIAPVEEYDLKEIWDKYRDYKFEQGLAPSTISIDYDRRIGNLLPLLPTLDLNRSVDIRNWISSNKPPREAARIMVQLNACSKWSVECGLISDNPFRDIKDSLKVKRKSKDGKAIDPFTPEERDDVIQAFRQSTHYSYYYPLIVFLFYTGARPNEAIALRHQDVDLSQHRLTFLYSYTERVLRKGLKSEDERTIILSQTAEDAVREEIENKRPNKHGLIFPAKDGGYINWLNFNIRAWKTILNDLPHISYKKPYQTRHTFITLQLKAGQTPQDIAKYCGNTSTVIFNNYAGFTREFKPLEIIVEPHTNHDPQPVHQQKSVVEVP